jgi:hypothetical protein
MAAGVGLTVTTVVAAHPDVNVNEIVAKPGAIPETDPVEPTVATPVLLLLQVPVPPSTNEVMNPWQTDATPVIAAGIVFTVTTVVIAQPEPSI